MSALTDGLTDRPWIADALCTQVDTELFFPEKGGNSNPAKTICTACTVRADCLTDALDRDERFGIWGGFSERERRALKDENALNAALQLIASTPINLPTIPTREQPAPTPTTTRQEPAMPTIAAPTRPDLEVTTYVADMARILSTTEGHPDKLVRDLRKLAVQAIQALSTASTPTRVPAPTSRRPETTLTTSSPTAEAGDTPAKVIRTWAAEQGLNCPKFGRVPDSLREAYTRAHGADAA